MQTTSHILMIRPVSFVYNEQTAVNNAFQSATDETSQVQEKALAEFDTFVSVLRSNGVDVTVVQDTAEPHTPDSIFPNNWVSFHSNGTVMLYPMFAANRRAERKPHVLDIVAEKFQIGQTIDLTGFENEDIFLEGTGSMVLDRDRQIAYACISPRTNEKVLGEFCRKMNYTPVLFTSTDGNGQEIYHTNVMMCVADGYVVICLESIASPTEQQHVSDTILRSGKEIIPISLKQMNHFAGNMLQVESRDGEKLLVMSTQAYESLSEEQIERLRSFNRIVHSAINTIETNGGGSARCMMAEIYLKAK
ncbi:arginine deiminase-related protein [Terrimonas sp. NA20]|uniref:Arginine deiminase-related protein n=1 Tax=Terrimonas ginsenosidimutans TaxID=2908004 RepID=A0ABS9KR20_9BACT|nr:arginine deiminase-related protein [Terrimonas ginsenosidimutans]MCG2614754.1 arginine deiminase-related protein [Terrimonas ginsenosidimutans]